MFFLLFCAINPLVALLWNCLRYFIAVLSLWMFTHNYSLMASIRVASKHTYCNCQYFFPCGLYLRPHESIVWRLTISKRRGAEHVLYIKLWPSLVNSQMSHGPLRQEAAVGNCRAQARPRQRPRGVTDYRWSWSTQWTLRVSGRNSSSSPTPRTCPSSFLMGVLSRCPWCIRLQRSALVRDNFFISIEKPQIPFPWYQESLDIYNAVNSFSLLCLLI